ncbi:MAG TPA: hypothetical protein ENL34_08085 [Chloroflexi bacterium]|nr:hypothetical protein [Chloroflexota bacterium]
MLDRAKMRAVSKAFQMVFIKTLQAGGVQTPSVQAAMTMLMEIPQTDWKGLYRWFLGLPIMRHWIGDRQAQQLEADGFEVVHKPWEATLSVLRDDLMFDKLGGYRPAIANMASERELLPYRQLLEVMKDMRAGTAFGNCFDGYPLISASHPTGTNLGTAALTHASLDDAILAMRSQTDVTVGDSLLIEPTHLWYHQSLQATVTAILDRRQMSIDGITSTSDVVVDNDHYKLLKPIALPLGSGKGAWWGLYSERVGQDQPGPILWQYLPGGDNFVALDSDTDIQNFMRRELLFGTEKWGAAAPGFPQFIWASDGTT